MEIDMETTGKKQEVKEENVVNEGDEGYKNLARFNDYVGQIFGPDLRGNNN